jgi:hypothetical protein
MRVRKLYCAAVREFRDDAQKRVTIEEDKVHLGYFS